MIIGITGSYCSGKDTVAAYLIQKGFAHLSLSDILREEAAARKLSPNRETLIALGNELREKHGPGVLAQMALSQMNGGNIAVSSIRNPSEVAVLRTRPDFILIALDAPQTLRWDRMKARKALHNIATFEQFQQSEQIEQSSDSNKQQLHLVISQADKVLINAGTIQELENALEAIIRDGPAQKRSITSFSHLS